MTVTYTPSSITLTCYFAVGSPALGCSVHILSQERSEVEVRTATRDTNGQGLSLTVQVTVDKLETAIYTVIVYDIESNGEASTDGAPAHTQTVDIAQPTIPPSTTPDTTSCICTHNSTDSQLIPGVY